MQQILTSEIGERWIQPSLVPDNNCSNCKRSLGTEEGLYCFPKNKLVKPEGYCKKFEQKLNPVPKCPDCKLYNFEYKRYWGKEGVIEDKAKPIHSCLNGWGKYLDNLDGCNEFKPKSETPSKICGPCSECNSFDTSIPDDSIWKFCLSKGKYLSQNDLKGCEDFKPIIPYQSPSKSRRSRGDGSGYIRLHPIVKNGKTYEQYYYHYELWEGGQCITKNCRYIPKKKLETIQSLDRMKAPVTKILYELSLIV